MRKALLTVLSALLLAGLFAGSWYVTGMLSGDETTSSTPGEGAGSGSLPANDSDTPDATTPGTADTGNGARDGFAIERPVTIDDFTYLLDTVATTLAVNPIFEARMNAYAGIAAFDATLRAGTDAAFVPSLSPAFAGQGLEQGILAGSTVMAELVANPQVSETVASWGELTAESRKVVDAVLAAAAADGYDAISSDDAPAYEGPLAWKPGGDATGSPLEPRFGDVKTLRTDSASCPVAPAPASDIESERAGRGTVTVGDDTPSPKPPFVTKYNFLVLSYLQNEFPDKTPGLSAAIAQSAIVALYDGLILTWKAKWANGVASPLDLSAGTALPYPSYPLWPSVALSLSETFVSGVMGEKVTVADLIDAARTSEAPESVIAALEDDAALLQPGPYAWQADITAGRQLGECLARQALAAVGR